LREAHGCPEVDVLGEIGAIIPQRIVRKPRCGIRAKRDANLRAKIDSLLISSSRKACQASREYSRCAIFLY
jgi:hypothetical protein